MVDEVNEIPLENIYWMDPTDITEDQIHNMAASILVHGQIEAIVVNVKDKKGYRGICGRLRYDGMKYRWRGEPEGKTILARIHKFKNEVEIKMWQLAENLHRREVPPMHKARQFRDLYDLIRKGADEEPTIQTLATAIEDMTGDKQSVKTIQHYLSLTKLEPKVQDILTGEKMPLRYGLELLRIKDSKKQVKAAKHIQKDPEAYSNVRAVRWHVEEIVAEERRDRQKQRLEKKAEELRSQGKIVYLDTPYGSYEDYKKYHQFWQEPPEKCKDCPKLGVLLRGNFQQRPICTDLECHKKTQAEERKKEGKKHQEQAETLKAEQVRIYNMDLDVRHWRLALYGLIENWPLKHLLGIEREEYEVGGMKEAVWNKVQSLDEEECKKLLIRKAVEEVLTGAQMWRGGNPAKKWAVEEFNLTRDVFLGEEDEVGGDKA